MTLHTISDKKRIREMDADQLKEYYRELHFSGKPVDETAPLLKELFNQHYQLTGELPTMPIV